jgi:effector-binding domain-containing protein
MFRNTDAIPLAATAIFKGFYSEMALWEGMTAKWIEENEYEVIGCEQFYCLEHLLNCQDTNNYRTEIQLPIKKV